MKQFYLANLDDPRLGQIRTCEILRYPVVLLPEGRAAIVARIEPPWSACMVPGFEADECLSIVVIEDAEEVWHGLHDVNATYWPKPVNVASVLRPIQNDARTIDRSIVSNEWRDAVYVDEPKIDQ